MAQQPPQHRIENPDRLRMPPLCGWLLSLLVLLLSGYSAANDTTVVNIHYAEASEIAEALEGLVDPGGSVRAYQNQLIINSSPANTAELKDIIQLLDEPPRKLLISVKSSNQYSGNNGGLEVSGASGNGGNRRVVNPDGTVTETSVKLRSNSRGVSGTSGADQSVQSLEGHDAYVVVSQSAALRSGHYGRATPVSAQQGFWVNARVNGQQVIVSLHARNDRLDKRQLNTASVATRVQGKLGQWLAVGSIAGSDGESGRGIDSLTGSGGGRAIASSTSNSRDIASVVYVKVQLLE